MKRRKALVVNTNVWLGPSTTTESLVFDGGRYALMCFRKEAGRYRYILYEEYGRKLKHGKRRRPVANADVRAPLHPRVLEDDHLEDCDFRLFKNKPCSCKHHSGPRLEEILKP